VGEPICPYDELKVVDPDGKEVSVGVDGELVSKGPGIFTGYFKSAADRAKTLHRTGSSGPVTRQKRMSGDTSGSRVASRTSSSAAERISVPSK